MKMDEAVYRFRTGIIQSHKVLTLIRVERWERHVKNVYWIWLVLKLRLLMLTSRLAMFYLSL